MLLLAAAATALAAAPFQLPEGEDAAAWASALELAGFVPGDASAGPAAELRAVAGSWELAVRDRFGRVHVVQVTAPRTRREREDIAWTAQSLLDPVVPTLSRGLSGPDGPPAVPPPPAASQAPAAPPPVVASRPRGEPRPGPPGPARPAAPVPPPPVATEPVSSAASEPAAADGTSAGAAPPTAPDTLASVPVVIADTPASTGATAAPAPEPLPASSAAVVTAGASDTAASHPRAAVPLYARAGGGLLVRGGAVAAPSGRVEAGVRAGPWTVGGVGEARAASAIRAGPDASAWGLLVGAEGGWRPEGRVAPELSLSGSATRYQFEQWGAPVGDAWVPAFGAGVGVSVALAEHVRLHATVRGRYETRSLAPRLDGTAVAGWSPWSCEPALAVSAELGSRDAPED